MASRTYNREKTTMYLNIRSKDDQHEFLREVLPDFLKVVDPERSGLLDILFSADLLTGSDIESLCGRNIGTRKVQARKLWFQLTKIPVQAFVRQVSPVLVKEFPHIIPDKFLTQENIDVTSVTDDDTCLRHDIRNKIRPATFADLLYQHGCLDLQEYEALASETKETDSVWSRLFQSCGQAEDMAQLERGVRGLLDTRGMHVPHALRRLLTSGLPCTCGAQDLALLPAPSASLVRKVDSWMMKLPPPSRCSATTSSCASSYSTLELQSLTETSSSFGSGGDSRSLVNEVLTDGAGHSSGTMPPIVEEGALSEASPTTRPTSTPEHEDAQPTLNNRSKGTTTRDVNTRKMESLCIDNDDGDGEDGDDNSTTAVVDGETNSNSPPQMKQPGTGTEQGAPGRRRRQVRQMSSPLGEALGGSGPETRGKFPVRPRGFAARGYETL